MASILASLHMRNADDRVGGPQGSRRSDKLIAASIQWADSDERYEVSIFPRRPVTTWNAWLSFIFDAFTVAFESFTVPSRTIEPSSFAAFTVAALRRPAFSTHQCLCKQANSIEHSVGFQHCDHTGQRLHFCAPDGQPSIVERQRPGRVVGDRKLSPRPPGRATNTVAATKQRPTSD